MSDAKNTDEEQEISPEEATHRRAIEQEKSVYRESFDKLRVLKPEIEHIRKVRTLENYLRSINVMLTSKNIVDTRKESRNPSNSV